MLSGADQVWISTGIILVLLTLLAYSSIQSTIKLRKGISEDQMWMKTGQTIIWWILLVSILIRTIVGLSFLAANKNYLNGNEINVRFMF